MVGFSYNWNLKMGVDSVSDVIKRIEKQLEIKHLDFSKKPLLIGGMAMEYYGLRKSGADIDLMICEKDYQSLALANPDKRKDIWGDLGIVDEPFEMWRSIMLLDYDFYIEDAVDEGVVYVVSLERLLFMCVLAMDIPKYKDDLKLIKDYYTQTFSNVDYAKTQQKHIATYKRTDGIVWGGKYSD